jgi:hypothetical protein
MTNKEDNDVNRNQLSDFMARHSQQTAALDDIPCSPVVDARTDIRKKRESRDQRNICNSRRAEHAPIAFNLVGRTERLRVIVGELDRGPAFNF